MVNVARKPASVTAVVEAGGVQGVVAAMTVLGDEDDEIVILALRVLANLAGVADDENIRIMGEEGAVQAIVDLCETQMGNAALLDSAFVTLLVLVKNPANAEMIAKQNTSNTVFAALRQHNWREDLCLQGMALVRALCATPALITIVAESDINAGVVGVLTAHSGQVCVCVCRVCVCVCVNIIYLSFLLTHTHILTHVQPKIRQHSLVVISRVCRKERVALRMQTEHGVVKLVLGIFKHNLHDHEACAECFQALGSLSRIPENRYLCVSV
jgi:hypothetical protein